MNTKHLLAATAAIALVACIPARAADDVASEEKVQNAIDVAFGAALTSNYISRGATQTDDDPAVQGYIEASYGIAYAGVWASNVKFGGVSDVEFDFYAGVRPEFGDLSLDFGYVRYWYPKDPTIYGELYAKASYTFMEKFTPGVEIYYDPHNETTWGVAKAEVSGLPLDLTFSTKIGTDFGTLNLAKNKVAWDAGFSRTFYDVVTLDVRYHDSNLDPARVMATLSFDTSLSALTGKN